MKNTYHPTQHDINNLKGMIDLGMKKEALREARKFLRCPHLTADMLNAAVDAVLILADRLKPWIPTVDASYSRLMPRERALARAQMISFYAACSNHSALLNLLPNHRLGSLTPGELAFAMNAAMLLVDTKRMDQLERPFFRATRKIADKAANAHVWLILAEYLARKGECEQALLVLERIAPDPTLGQNAIMAMVDIHVARAMQVLISGVSVTKSLYVTTDPAIELTLPGINKAVHDSAGKTYRRAWKILERILPKERQKEFGLEDQNLEIIGL